MLKNYNKILIYSFLEQIVKLKFKYLFFFVATLA